jgi:hypothetical protein
MKGEVFKSIDLRVVMAEVGVHTLSQWEGVFVTIECGIGLRAVLHLTVC